MSTKLTFTDQAKSAISSYLLEVREHLKSTDLSTGEISDSLDELEDHLYQYCEIKAQGKAVTTDIVKKGIDKLGTPKTIAETLQNELDFAAQININDHVLNGKDSSGQNRSMDTQSKVEHDPRFIEIRASHLVSFYNIILWTTTAMSFFIFFNNNEGIDDIFGYFAILYGISVIYLVLVTNNDKFQYNLYLRAKFIQNFHLNIIPPIVVVYVLLQWYVYNPYLQIFPSLAMVAFIWFLNFVNLGGREYFIKLKNKLESI